MTLARWLLVHSLSISILVMLGVGYYFKHELKLNQAYSQLLKIDPDSLLIPTNVSSKKAYASNKEAIVAVEQSVDDKVVLTEPQASNLAVIEPQKPIDNVVEMNKQADVKKDVSLTTQLASTLMYLPQSSKPPVDNLLLARQAYWNQDYQLAIDHYAKEIDDLPNSPDLHGELGNLYYGLENYELAAMSYLKAGELMIELNDQARAKQIYDILISIAPEKANELLLLKNDKYQ